MKESAGCIFVGIVSLVYFVMGLVQLLAIVAVVQIWPGWHWLPAGFLGLILGYVPLAGSVLGMVGAVHAWGWGVLSAILFFGWPYFLYALLFLGLGGPGIWNREE